MTSMQPSPQQVFPEVMQVKAMILLMRVMVITSFLVEQAMIMLYLVLVMILFTLILADTLRLLHLVVMIMHLAEVVMTLLWEKMVQTLYMVVMDLIHY